MSDNCAPSWLYNLHNFDSGIARKLAEGMQTSIYVGESSMLSVVRIEPNTAGQIHSHPEEQWGVLLKGECRRIQGDEKHDVIAGDFWYTPPNVSHGIQTYKSSVIILDIFSPPRPEYRKTGSGFGNAK